jgi:hypothetical protein
VANVDDRRVAKVGTMQLPCARGGRTALSMCECTISYHQPRRWDQERTSSLPPQPAPGAGGLGAQSARLAAGCLPWTPSDHLVALDGPGGRSRVGLRPGSWSSCALDQVGDHRSAGERPVARSLAHGHRVQWAGKASAMTSLRAPRGHRRQYAPRRLRWRLRGRG